MSAKHLTIEKFLGEIGKAAGFAQAEAARYRTELVARGHLDVTVKIGKDEVSLDGVAMLPTDVVALSKLIIETEADVVFGEDQCPSMRFSRGILNRSARVKVKAVFGRSGPTEAIEIIRNKADQDLQAELNELELRQEESDG